MPILSEKTPDQERESKRNRINSYHYVIDPDTHEIQRTLGKPSTKPHAVIYLPHYEDSLRVEVELPEKATPEEIQRKLDDYKQKFINWFGGDKKNGYMWGNKTRRWAYNKVAMKIQGVKVPREDNRSLRTLFMYKDILSEFKAGKTRKSIVEEISKNKKFEYEQVRKFNKRSRKTGIVMKIERKPSTINRDITSLVKSGILIKEKTGIYKVSEGYTFNEKKVDGLGKGFIQKRGKKIKGVK